MSPLKTINGQTGGDNAFDNNTTGISVYGELWLQNGSNTFKKGSNYNIVASLNPCGTCGFMNNSWQVFANNNYWNPAPASNFLPNGSATLSGTLYSTWVHSFPPAPATLTGNVYTSISSTCFSETSSIINRTGTWSPPFYKNDPNQLTGAGEKTSKLKVYPNPASNKISLNVVNENPTTYFVSIFDLTGKQLLSQNINVDKQVNIELSTDILASGTYILYVNTEDGIINEKHKIVILK